MGSFYLCASNVVVGLILANSGGTTVLAAPPVHVLEVRRTFESAHCDTGELYIDGMLRGVFLTSSNVIPGIIKKSSLREATVSSIEITIPDRYGVVKRKGLRFLADQSASAFLEAALLDSDTYSDFTKPRKKLHTLSPSVMLIGSSVENRKCTISSPGTAYFDGQETYPSATDLFGSQLFDGQISRKDFNTDIAKKILLVFSDKSARFELHFGAMMFLLDRPARLADAISDGDECMTAFEHGENRWVQANTQTYRRKDDIWVCTIGALTGTPSGRGLEIRRQVGFVEIWSGGPACTTVFGLPIQTTYLITRKENGHGSEAYTRCTGDDAWKRIAASVEILQ